MVKAVCSKVKYCCWAQSGLYYLTFGFHHKHDLMAFQSVIQVCCFRLTTVLPGEVSGSLANYLSSSQGDEGQPGTPGLPVSSRHFIHILHMLSEYVRSSKRAGCIKTGSRPVCKGRCKAGNQQ